MAIKQPKGEYESALRSQILETHYSEEFAFPLKPVLDIIELIFCRSTTHDLPRIQTALFSDHQDILLEISRLTTAISREIFYNWFDGVDAHTTTVDILYMIKHCNWDAKLVLALGAFAMSFGEFRLVSELHFTNPIAKAVALLKKFPETLEFTGNLKKKLDSVFLLLKAVLDMAKSIIEFYELSHNDYFTSESPEIIAATVDIPIAVYWTIWSIVDCASLIWGLTGMTPEYVASVHDPMHMLDSWELSSSTHKLETIRSLLVEKINFCYRFIEKKKDDEIVNEIARVLESSHIDNSKSLKVLFRQKDGHQPLLFDCLHQNLVAIEDLRGKVVGLYITDLNIVSEDYLILQQIYPEKLDDQLRIENQYEIIWIPVEDYWTNEKHWRFENLRDQMEWLSLQDPSKVAPQVFRYIKETWGLKKKPLLVMMDAEGKIVHKDALQMMCIWGNQAYPFTYDTEKFLWQQKSWTITLLAEGIDQYLPTWIEEKKYICLYGGEDIEWIRRFTKTAKDVAQRCGIDLEMLYMGKNRARERVVKKIINVAKREKLSKALEWKLILYFWVRMEKMCISEPPEAMRGGTDEETKPEFFVPDDLVMARDLVIGAQSYNPIFSGVVKMLSFGYSSKGWAVIGTGGSSDSSSTTLFEADGEPLLKALVEHDKWRRSVDEYGFLIALERYYHNLCNDLPHCINMLLPDTKVKRISCASCSNPMDEMVMYSCCSDRASFGFHENT